MIEKQDYVNVDEKENEIIINYDHSFEKILRQKKADYLKKLKSKKKNMNFVIDLGSNWENLLSSHKNLPQNKGDNLKSLVKQEFKSLRCLEPSSKLLEELEFIKRKEDKALIKKISKKIKYIRRSPDFFYAISHGYLELLVCENKPFNLMYKLIKKLKNQTFEIINPFEQNLENSFSPEFALGQAYLIDILIGLSQKMIEKWENKKSYEDFKAIMLTRLNSLMEEDKLFQVLQCAMIKTLVREHCISNQDREAQENLLNQKELSLEHIELVAQTLEVKIGLYGYEVEKNESGEKYFSEKRKLFGKDLEGNLKILLYYGNKTFYLGYDEDFD